MHIFKIPGCWTRSRQNRTGFEEIRGAGWGRDDGKFI